jgi:hypothetical protein
MPRSEECPFSDTSSSLASGHLAHCARVTANRIRGSPRPEANFRIRRILGFACFAGGQPAKVESVLTVPDLWTGRFRNNSRSRYLPTGQRRQAARLHFLLGYRRASSVVSDPTGVWWTVRDITATCAPVTIFTMGSFALLAWVQLTDETAEADVFSSLRRRM